MSRNAGKSVALAAAYGSHMAKLGTLIHDAMMHREPAPAKPKKPWQKGFIPTAGKKQELKAPVLGGEWQLHERNGNQVEYRINAENPFSYGWPRIKGNLATRRWVVSALGFSSVIHDSSVWEEQVLFTGTAPEACVVFVALDPELIEPRMRGSINHWGSSTARLKGSGWPMLQNLPRTNQQLDHYRALVTEYCRKDVMVFDENTLFKNKLAELDKADDGSV